MAASEGRGTMQDHPTAPRGTAKKAETAAVAPPCAMVIFGAGGDLTKRLVTPALYNLVTAKRLPDGFRLVGVDRSPEHRGGMARQPHQHDGRVRHQGRRRVPGRPYRPDGLALADRPDDVPARRLHRSAGLSPTQGASRGPRQDGRHGGQPSLLSRRPRPLLRHHRRRPRRGGHGDGTGRGNGGASSSRSRSATICRRPRRSMPRS